MGAGLLLVPGSSVDTSRLARAVIFGYELVHGHSQAVYLLGQPRVLDQQLRLAFRNRLAMFSIGLAERLVARRLPRLREQNQRRCIGGLQAERQIQQDEWIRVEVDKQLETVEHDPERDNDRLTNQVLRGAEEAGDRLGKGAEAPAAERSRVLLVNAAMEVWYRHRHRLSSRESLPGSCRLTAP